MKKHITLSVLLVLSAGAVDAKCCGAQSCCRRTIRVGGCCKMTFGPVLSTENAPWKVVPYDIQMLSDDSLVKQRYVKCFDIVTKSIKSWTRQKYESRRKFLDGKLWVCERKKLEAALNRNTRLSREPAVTKDDVLKLAEEMVIYGRGLTVGNSSGIGIREVAELYRFDNVARFLKDATEYSRYRRKGFGKSYPSDNPEFRDFETLVKALNPVEWGEFRVKLAEMNLTYANNRVCKAGLQRANGAVCSR